MEKHTHGGDVYRHTNVIDFSANCNPLGTPKAVEEAIARSASMVWHYPDVQCQRLREALAVYEEIEEEKIICGNGAADIIFSLVLAKKPKKALLPAPTFAEYEQALRCIGCEVEYFILKEEQGFQIGEGLLDCITKELDILFLCNPNNPTGLLLSREFVVRIMEECIHHQVFLVLDECFIDFVEKPKDYTMKEYITENRLLFILKAFTKRYAMAGVRLGYGLCADFKLLEEMNACSQPWNVSIPAQEAGIAALKEEEYVNRAMELVKTERAYLKREMEEAGFLVYPSAANYLFFQGPVNLAEDCLKQGILIRDCSNYLGLQKGYYRVAVRTHEENEKLALVLQKEGRKILWQRQ